MKTLQEIYAEIIGSDELKKAFAEAAKDGKIAEFLKAQGCEAGAEEIKAFLKGRMDQQLSEEELDSVAGGGCNNKTLDEAYFSLKTVGIGCAIEATHSAIYGHTGQATADDGRLCSKEKPV